MLSLRQFIFISNLFLFIFLPKVSNSQTVQTKIKFDKPTLEHLDLQEFNNLPRYGQLDDYNFGNLDKTNNSEYQKNLEVTRGRIHKNMWNYIRYYSLVELKFLYKAYPYLNSNELYKTSGITREDKFSYTAQQHIYKLGVLWNNPLGFKKYFYNPVVTSKNRGGYSRFWGGFGATEFAQVAKYKEFVETDLPAIKEVSETIWVDDISYGYLVTKVQVNASTYDKVKKGFWINYSNNHRLNAINKGVQASSYKARTNPNLKDSLLSYSRKRIDQNIMFQYLPEKDFERNLTRNEVFVSIPFEEVKTWPVNTTMSVYTVQKIKLSYYNVDYNNPSKRTYEVNISYNLEEPIVAFFRNAALTQKMSEFKLTKN